MTTVLLDTGPLGLIASPKQTAETVACRAWVARLIAANIFVIIPEIADYEVRRELVRLGKTRSIQNLDNVTKAYQYLPVSTDAWRQAAQFWAQARQQGQPTAGNRELDGDVILAAQAATLGLPEGDVVIATTNAPHLRRYVPAEDWQDIRPAEVNL